MKTRAYFVVLGIVLLADSPSIGMAQSNADIDRMKQQLAEVQRQRQVESGQSGEF